jgi:hypothetical protein
MGAGTFGAAAWAIGCADAGAVFRANNAATHTTIHHRLKNLIVIILSSV